MKPILLIVLLLGLYGGACIYLCFVAGIELGLIAFVAMGIFLFYVINGPRNPKPLGAPQESGLLAKLPD